MTERHATPFPQSLPAAGQVVLMVRIGMGLQSQDITGYVLFLMDLPSLDQMIRKVRSYFGMD